MMRILLALGLGLVGFGCSGVKSADVLVMADSPLGQVLASPDGKLLYMFDNDPLGMSLCNDNCLGDWPPYLSTPATADLIVAAGITATVSLLSRAEGQQVLVNNYALYHFSGDRDPGDLRGQGILLDWFTLTYAGQPNMTKLDPPVWSGADTGKALSAASTSLGKIVADGHGRSLYAFKDDTGVATACLDDCTAVWPPYEPTSPSATADLDATKLGTLLRPDGKLQLTYAGRPLYSFYGDWNAGDVRGHGVGDGDWFALAPDGTAMK
jgi:predicted lipoprotein with Yx(FWY)xxD motif